MGIAPETRTAPELELWLTDRVAFHLQKSPDEIAPGTPLADYGIDSVATISICGEIEEHYRLPVFSTVAYDFPTVRAISNHPAERSADAIPNGMNATDATDAQGDRS